MKELTEDEFWKEYKPMKNHINASFHGCMYETYGEELEYIKSCNPDQVWTIIEGDGGMYISAGFHLVNRIGYLVTLKAWDNINQEIELESAQNGLRDALSIIEEALKCYVEDCLGNDVDSTTELQESWNLIKLKLENLDEI